MKKYPHSRILREKLKKQYLNTVPKSYPSNLRYGTLLYICEKKKKNKKIERGFLLSLSLIILQGSFTTRRTCL